MQLTTDFCDFKFFVYSVTYDGSLKLLLSFDFPALGESNLNALIDGKNVQDRDDDGFFIKQKDKLVKISIRAEPAGGIKNLTKIYLDHEVCKPAFLQLKAASRFIKEIDE